MGDQLGNTSSINSSESGGCSIGDPYTYQFFPNMTAASIALLVITSILSIVTLVIFLESVIFIQKTLPSTRRKMQVTWIIGLFPAYSLTSLLAIYVPRAHFIATIHSSLYLSVTLYCFVLLIFDYYGGFDAAIVLLSEDTSSIAFPPLLCCCVCCLPKVKVSKRFLRIMKRLVFQTALVGPIVRFIATVLWTDGRYKPGLIAFDEAYVYLNTILIVSTVLAMYGLQAIYKVSLTLLKEFRLRPKFLSVQITLLLGNIQNAFLGILVSTNVIKCSDPFSSKTRANFLFNFLIIIEMFLMSIAARFLFRTRTGNLNYLISRPSLKLTQKVARDDDLETAKKRESQVPNNNVTTGKKSECLDGKAKLFEYTLSDNSVSVSLA
ncbi:organic solute transporter subunit alpha-like [Ptychodera flava]|uniref:organic solute transporter subunit alpha-like n=1 Tax=Ptychodera flava TaxID=63121 RepID=UPI00396A22A6